MSHSLHHNADPVQVAIAQLPQEPMPADLEERIFETVLAELRSGERESIVTFDDADFDAMESEQLGAYLVGGGI